MKVIKTCLYETSDGRQYRTKEELDRFLFNRAVNDKLKPFLKALFREFLLTDNKIQDCVRKHIHNDLGARVLNENDGVSIEGVLTGFCQKILSESFLSSLGKLDIYENAFYVYDAFKDAFENTSVSDEDFEIED